MKSAHAEGLAQAEKCAAANGPQWALEAAQALRTAARFRTRRAYTIEQLRGHIHGLQAPKDARAWGSATRKAVALGYLVHTDEFARAASSHGSPKPLYRAGPNA